MKFGQTLRNSFRQVFSREEDCFFTLCNSGNLTTFTFLVELKAEGIMQKECIIYMIDDDLEDQSFFTMALERIDIPHQCIFAESGVQALQRLCSDPAFMPDVIFLDFNMPRMNGLECLQELKKIHRLADVPVYMYSTSRDPEASELCLAEGAAGVLRKLSSIDATTGVLTEVLSSQHAQTF